MAIAVDRPFDMSRQVVIAPYSFFGVEKHGLHGYAAARSGSAVISGSERITGGSTKAGKKKLCFVHDCIEIHRQDRGCVDQAQRRPGEPSAAEIPATFCRGSKLGKDLNIS